MNETYFPMTHKCTPQFPLNIIILNTQYYAINQPIIASLLSHHSAISKYNCARLPILTSNQSSQTIHNIKSDCQYVFLHLYHYVHVGLQKLLDFHLCLQSHTSITDSSLTSIIDFHLRLPSQISISDFHHRLISNFHHRLSSQTSISDFDLGLPSQTHL